MKRYITVLLVLATSALVQSAPDPTPDPIVGKWAWSGGRGAIAVFNSDGTIIISPKKDTATKGAWECLDKTVTPRKYSVTGDRVHIVYLIKNNTQLSETNSAVKSKHALSPILATRMP